MISAFSANPAMVCLPVRCPISLIDRTISRSIRSCRISRTKLPSIFRKSTGKNLSNVRQTRWDRLLLPNREIDGRWTVDVWAPPDGRVINGGTRFMF
jgi:hypothetical protein